MVFHSIWLVTPTLLIHVHSACCTVWHWHHNILRTSTIVLGQVWWPLPPETQTAAARQEVVHTSFSALEQHAITVLTYHLQVDTKNMRFSPCLRARCHGLLCQSACSWKDYERLFCMDFPVLQSDDSCNTGFWWLGHGICDKNTCKSIILKERWSFHMQSWTWQRNGKTYRNANYLPVRLNLKSFFAIVLNCNINTMWYIIYNLLYIYSVYIYIYYM